jgi:hypothetical protein
MKKIILHKVIADIRFWLILFFLIRLIHITQPPLESSHNWRQTFTNMLARNFYEGEADILHPVYDMSGEKNGIIGSEFPLFSYSIAVSAKIFGYTHWIGRLINLIVSTLGVYCFYLLLLQFFNRRLAFFSAILLMLSIWFMFSRKIMPDTFSVSLAIFSLYFGINYLTRGKNHHLLLFFLFGMAGVLAKIPAVIILSVLFPLVFSGFYMKRRRINIVIPGAFIFIAMVWWYFFHAPMLAQTYGNQLYFTKTFSEGLVEIINEGASTFKRFAFDAFQGYIGFVLFAIGLVLAFVRKQKKMIFLFSVSFVFLIIYALKTGAVFSTHSYYIIPFVPVMALFAGYILTEIPVKWLGVVLLIAASVESIANQQHDVSIKEFDTIKLNYEPLADKYIPSDALVLTNGGQSTTQMYFINRKGWSLENNQISDNLIAELKQKGLQYIFMNTCRDNTPLLNMDLIHKQECIAVYKVN